MRLSRTNSVGTRVRRRMRVKGIVQGVGFRPFVHTVARSLGLTGWVLNDSEGVLLEVQGSPDRLEEFRTRLTSDAPPMARVMDVVISDVPLVSETVFSIRPSATLPSRRTLVSPDSATCPDCLRELFDPHDRRSRYPFINCTNCGPRYTIIRDVPYDRPNTTMAAFQMCPDCQREYDDPADRRFHAQPNACPRCGPRLTLLNAGGTAMQCADPILKTTALLRGGHIVAVKGLGGFHLAVDATSEEAVCRLRERKHREEKPLAVMVADVQTAGRLGILTQEATEALQSPARPIVLVPRRPGADLASCVAPHSQYVGLMLPYTPLHHLLMAEGPAALVLTSGNRTDEPIAIENDEAVRRLGHIADAFLVHDRGICLRSDDSVVLSDETGIRQVRRSRGFVPVPISIPAGCEVLAVGSELKNTVCLTRIDQAFVSQHMGDLKNLDTLEFFTQTIRSLKRILDVEPDVIAHDMHPDYLSARYAREQAGMQLVPVQHHHAHAISVMTEHGLQGEVLAVIWDGTGYGPDGTTWGSEFLRASPGRFERLGHLEYIPLAGADRAVREPWRVAVAGLRKAFGPQWRRHVPKSLNGYEQDFDVLETMLTRNLNAPLSCGAGRLFDMVSSLSGICQRQTYEGQAAIELEAAIDEAERGTYRLTTQQSESVRVLAWEELVRDIVSDLSGGADASVIAARFHNALTAALIDLTEELARESGLDRVVLSGGVFQNRHLSRGVAQGLRERRLVVYESRLVPANDGGVSLGQARVARAVLSDA